VLPKTVNSKDKFGPSNNKKFPSKPFKVPVKSSELGFVQSESSSDLN
jgi:hypothetical protein